MQKIAKPSRKVLNGCMRYNENPEDLVSQQIRGDQKNEQKKQVNKVRSNINLLTSSLFLKVCGREADTEHNFLSPGARSATDEQFPATQTATETSSDAQYPGQCCIDTQQGRNCEQKSANQVTRETENS